LVVLAEGKIQAKNNATGNAQPPSPQASDIKVPDFHAFDWRLCKVLKRFIWNKLSKS